MLAGIQTSEQRLLSQACCEYSSILVECDVATSVDGLDRAKWLESCLDFCFVSHHAGMEKSLHQFRFQVRGRGVCVGQRAARSLFHKVALVQSQKYRLAHLEHFLQLEARPEAGPAC